MEAQFQIRQNAMELQDYMSDLLQWEQSVKEKDKDVKCQKNSESSVRKHTSRNNIDNSASQHTYEHYKDKWEKFDVEAALQEVDDHSKLNQDHQHVGFTQQEADIPKPRSLPVDAEGWRLRGNEFYKLQNYECALDCYDRSICLQPSHLAYANRGLVHYKRGDYATSIKDLGYAIEMDAKYVKAYQRRSASHKALKNLQCATQDIEFALRLETEGNGILKERDDCLQQLVKQRGIDNLEGSAWNDIFNVQIVGEHVGQLKGVQQVVIKEINSVDQNFNFVNNQQLQQQQQEVQQASTDYQQQDIEKETNELNKQFEQKGDQQHNLQQERKTDEQKVKECSHNSEFLKEELPKSLMQQIELKSVESKQSLLSGDKQHNIEQSDAKVLNPDSSRSQQQNKNFQFNSEKLIQQFTKTKQSQMSSVDFEMKWKNIGTDLQNRIQFLFRIPARDFPKILKSSLTPQLLESIVSTVLTALKKMDQFAERQSGIQILSALTSVERFSMTVLCINSTTKKQWESDCGEISKIWNAEEQNQFENVRKKYRL